MMQVGQTLGLPSIYSLSQATIRRDVSPDNSFPPILPSGYFRVHVLWDLLSVSVKSRTSCVGSLVDHLGAYRCATTRCCTPPFPPSSHCIVRIGNTTSFVPSLTTLPSLLLCQLLASFRPLLPAGLGVCTKSSSFSLPQICVTISAPSTCVSMILRIGSSGLGV